MRIEEPTFQSLQIQTQRMSKNAKKLENNSLGQGQETSNSSLFGKNMHVLLV
jgi:hypothetical protein